jgi:ABC-type transport system involved in cytochrome c biogenesis permease subunit
MIISVAISSILLMAFCLVFMSIVETEYQKSPGITVEFTIVPFPMSIFVTCDSMPYYFIHAH